jgi:cyclophilin family peptidyl-prolyl cis-trans isomerase
MRSKKLSTLSGQSFGLELLENRAFLANTAFPTVGELSNPNNTVVRFQTNFGDVDIEMFDSAAPLTVANFLKYVRDGDYDRSFFHRLSRNNDGTDFVLQGGLTRLKNPSTTGELNGSTEATRAWESIPVDSPVQNEFNQSNLIRTLAMARLGGQVNSATSQFFFNLGNNSGLDNVDQGFTVFAKVLNDRSWNVITGISSAVTINTSLGSPFALGTNDGLPVRAGFTGNNVNDDQLVTILDAEIIKPQGVAAFYTYRYYFPEGFAGSTINEFLPLGNTGSATANYQVIIRSETRDAKPAGNADFWYRDKVVSTGTIAPNKRAGVTMSTFSNTAGNLVPKQGKPYGIEVWSTTPLAATLSHYDFGSSTFESFWQRPADVTGLTKWVLPDVQKGANIKDFPVWQSLSDLPATVNVKFVATDGATLTTTFSLEAFRRGGMDVSNYAQLADGRYSVEITSDRPIVAALTHYNTSNTLAKGGSTQIGETGNGASAGVLPGGEVKTSVSGSDTTVTSTDELSFYNVGSAAAVVTLIFSFNDPMTPDLTFTGNLSLFIPIGGRKTFDVSSDSGLRDTLAGKTYSITYRAANSVPVYATVLHLTKFSNTNTDNAATPFATTASTSHLFGEGFMNKNRAGVDLFETISVFNPNSAAFNAPGLEANVTVRFTFTDGFVLVQDFVVASGRRGELVLNNLQALKDQNASNRYYYSIEVVSDVPVIAQMAHYDLTLGGVQPSGGGITIGTQRNPILLSALGGP